MNSLYDQIIEDLKTVGLPVDFTLVLKPYSKSFYGRCFPDSKKIILYVYEDPEKTKLYSYSSLLLTAVHEAVHHLQFSRPTFVYCKGIMHNAEFHSLYQLYKDRTKALLLLREVVYNDSFCKKAM